MKQKLFLLFIIVLFYGCSQNEGIPYEERYPYQYTITNDVDSLGTVYDMGVSYLLESIDGTSKGYSTSSPVRQLDFGEQSKIIRTDHPYVALSCIKEINGQKYLYRVPAIDPDLALLYHLLYIHLSKDTVTHICLSKGESYIVIPGQ